MQNRRSFDENSACPRAESNCRTRFRKPMLYPLSYGGERLESYRRASVSVLRHLKVSEFDRDRISDVGGIEVVDNDAIVDVGGRNGNRRVAEEHP